MWSSTFKKDFLEQIRFMMGLKIMGMAVAWMNSKDKEGYFVRKPPWATGVRDRGGN